MKPEAPRPPPSPALAARNRGLARLWVQVKKAAIPAIVTGILGYGGGLVIPPSALYDRLFRQDPNDLSGTWFGGVAGPPATLKLIDDGRTSMGLSPSATACRGAGESRLWEITTRLWC